MISPDGLQLLFLRRPTEQGGRQLWVRSLDSLEARPVPGSGGVRASTLAAVWSPDSSSVLFTTLDGGLHRVDLEAGQSTTLVEPEGGRFYLGAWGGDGTILYGRSGLQGDENGVWMVQGSGAVPSQLTRAVPGSFHFPTALLPDGRQSLYVEGDEVLGRPTGVVRLGSLGLHPGEQDPSVLLETESPVSFVPGPSGAETGHVVFERNGRLLARAFDTVEARLGDQSIQLAQDVGYFAVAASGALSYIAGGDDSGVRSRLVRYDRAGRERLLRDVRAAHFHPLPEKKQQLLSGRLSLGLDPIESEESAGAPRGLKPPVAGRDGRTGDLTGIRRLAVPGRMPGSPKPKAQSPKPKAQSPGRRLSR